MRAWWLLLAARAQPADVIYPDMATLHGAVDAATRTERDRCWTEGFNRDHCCDHNGWGPWGQAQCWDGTYNFDRCCEPNHKATAEAADSFTLIYPRFRDGLNSGKNLRALRLPHFEKSECWVEHFSPPFCCDESFGEAGNMNCWNGDYNWRTCCDGIVKNTSHTSWLRMKVLDAGYWPDPWLVALNVPSGATQAWLLNLITQHGVEKVSPVMWFPLCSHKDFVMRRVDLKGEVLKHCEWYTQGSAFCSIEVRFTNTTPRVLPGGSNCRPSLHCPLWVPISVMTIDKAGSMSVLDWLSRLDGKPDAGTIAPPHPRFESLPSLRRSWERLGLAASKGLHALVDAVMESFGGLRYLDGLYRVKMTVNRYHTQGREDHRTIIPPPNHCFLCCSGQSDDRLRVVFVRNPFVRVVSYFRMSWINNTNDHPDCMTWSCFEDFLGAFSK
jgi:hypothetical protein